jgi:hypothetical protein
MQDRIYGVTQTIYAPYYAVMSSAPPRITAIGPLSARKPITLFRTAPGGQRIFSDGPVCG